MTLPTGKRERKEDERSRVVCIYRINTSSQNKNGTKPEKDDLGKAGSPGNTGVYVIDTNDGSDGKSTDFHLLGKTMA